MLEEGYTSLLTDKYQLTDSESIHTVDFENDNEGATEQINQWIYRNTNGMIDPMYEEPLDPDMAILLSSSLYFKGTVKNMVYVWCVVMNQSQKALTIYILDGLNISWY